jgi:hypothetical protein
MQLPRSSGTGKGGKSFQDRELASQVRSKTLESIKAILEDDPKVAEWSDYKKQLILKMSSNILPRLNEHTGADGSALFPDAETKQKSDEAIKEYLASKDTE